MSYETFSAFGVTPTLVSSNSVYTKTGNAWWDSLSAKEQEAERRDDCAGPAFSNSYAGLGPFVLFWLTVAGVGSVYAGWKGYHHGRAR